MHANVWMIINNYHHPIFTYIWLIYLVNGRCKLVYHTLRVWVYSIFISYIHCESISKFIAAFLRRTIQPVWTTVWVVTFYSEGSTWQLEGRTWQSPCKKGHPGGFFFDTVKSCRISEALFERPWVSEGMEMGLVNTSLPPIPPTTHQILRESGVLFLKGTHPILPWKLTNITWKSMVGRCIPYWNSPGAGDMLVFGGVGAQKMMQVLVSVS